MAKKSEAKKRAILDAALEEFESKGFTCARVDDIAARAGVSKGTIYNYFENKEALLTGLAEEVATQLQGDLTSSAAAKEPLPDQVLHAADIILRENGRGRSARILRLIWGEGLRRPEVTRPIYMKLLIPFLEGENAFMKGIRSSNLPQFVKDWPMAIAAPLVQGLLWQNLAGDVAPLDLRSYYEAYLKFLCGDDGERASSR